ITVEKVTARHQALLTKRDDYNQQRGELSKLKGIRDAKASELEKGLRLLLNDLHKKLTPTDPRWVEFGFKKPGARSTPDVPENLTAILIGTNAISMKWSAAARATSYRVWKKVIGEDDDFVPLESRTDLDHTLEGLPGNSTVQVAVSAINNGGESKLSSIVTVNTL
ncbi:MAG: fibronectin type III domain-containing protein, partial [Limisphaerales bacterium]